METETLTIDVQLDGGLAPRFLHFTRDQLQAVVQMAYDEHGISPQLWTATPAADRQHLRRMLETGR